MENQRYEDEIDLRDYIEVIIKRKWIILIVFFLCVVTATVVSFFMPKVYEATSKIQLGRVNELLVGKDEAKEMLLNRRLLSSIIKELNLDIQVGQLKKKLQIKDIKNTDLLEIKVQYPRPEMAVKINEAIVSSFVSKGQAIYKERASLIDEQLKELEAEIKNTEEAIKKVQNLTVNLSRSDTSQTKKNLEIILLQNLLSNYERNLALLKNKKNDIKLLLAKSKDFKIFEQAVIPEYPIKPKKKLNIAISSVLGLMLGVFIAFFQEFWEKGKSKT